MSNICEIILNLDYCQEMWFKDISYLELWQPLCLSKQNHLCNFGRRHHLFVCFVALHPKSTAMVIAGRSVHITTLFPGQA